MPPRAPARQGTSKAVPVVVSAGLAIGVFCGLLFGLGTGDKAEANGPAKGNNLKHTDDTNTGVDPGAAPAGLGATSVTPKNGGPGSDIGKPVTVVVSGSDATGSAAGSGGGIGSGTAAMAGSATAAPKGVKLTIDIDPDAAAQVAVITVDGKAIDGKATQLADGTKSVHVQVTAAGYHSLDEKLDIPSGDEADVKLKMQKKSSGGGGGSPGFGGASSGGNHVPVVPPRPKQPPKPPKGGIIDI